MSEPPTVALAGSGPAAAAVRAALADVEAAVVDRPPAEVRGTDADTDLAVVVAPAGAAAFDATAGGSDPWIAVEIGGLGARALDDLDAAVSVLGRVGYADLRLRAGASSPAVADRPSGDRSAVRLAGAVAGRRAVAALAGADLDGTVVEVAGTDVGPTRTLLPVPDAPPDRRLRRESDGGGDAADPLARAERALDDRFGPLLEAGERESFPAPYYLVATGDTTPFSDARAAEHAAGVAADWDGAFLKALGEGLERYAAGLYRADWFTVAPERTRANPVSPARFAAPEGIRPPDPTEPIPWVPGERLATGERVSLPAEFVHYPPPAERHRPAITTGLAVWSDGPGALAAGLAEVIERDATVVSWYSTYEPLALSVEDEGFAALARRARSEGLSVTPLLVTTDVDVPVVAVAVHRAGGAWPRFAVGSGAGLDPAAAARSGLAEALQNWMELRAMGPEAAADEGGAIGEYAAFPDAARAFVEREGPVPAASVGPDEVPTGPDRLRALVERVRDAGLDAYAARITPTDVASLGFEAVRVVVPEAQPLFTGEPYFGGRAESVPRRLGYEPRLDRPYHPYP